MWLQYSGYQESLHERKSARKWTKEFNFPISYQEVGLGLALLLQEPGKSGVVSVWGISGLWKSALVRFCYYQHMLHLPQMMFRIGNEFLQIIPARFTAYSWVTVPRPFNFMEFCQCLFLDFYSYDLQAKETTAIGIMKGQDPIEGCRKLLCQEKYLVVIDGLRSTDEWDLIKDALFPQYADGCFVVVITHEGRVARHCAPNEHNRVNVRSLRADEALNLLEKVCYHVSTILLLFYQFS